MQPITDSEMLRYPIGTFSAKSNLSAHDVQQLINDLADLPEDVRAVVSLLSSAQLDTPYRPDGWTVRQVVHHLPDSHMNGYIRFKLALTEQEPTIKAYDEAAWSELPDGRSHDVEGSLLLLDAVHHRWASLLRLMKPEDFARTYRHPETGVGALERSLQQYVWHGRHHLAHLRSAHTTPARA